MALFQPTNVYPSTLSGEGAGTIDATLALTVSWQVNGNSPMVAYQVKIMQNDTDSTLKFDSGKTTIATPFFGTNMRGEPQSFSMIISAAQLSTAGIVNGYANGYKLTIKQWWNANDAVEQTSASYFITRAEPTLALWGLSDYDKANFYYQDYTFYANYSQAQGDAVDWSHWELQALENGAWVTIDDTGIMYGTSGTVWGSALRLNYYHNGFAVDVNESEQNVPIQHRIKCTVQTENGVTVDTGWIEFTVKLSSTHRQNPLALCAMRDNDCVRIEMPKNFPILGDATGPYSFTTQNVFYEYLTLPAGTSVYFGGEGASSLDITPDNNYSVRYKLTLTDVSANVNCLDLDYADYHIYFSFGPSGFAVKKDNTVIWSDSTAAVSGDLFEIQLKDNAVYFGINHSGTVTANEYSISSWLNGATMQALTIYGPGIVRCVEIAYPISLTVFESDLASPYSYIVNTTVPPLFEGRFDGTLYTGPILGDVGGRTDSISVYRKEVGKPVFELIANIPFEQRVIYDYSALASKSYEYFFILLTKLNGNLRSQDRYGITTISPCWWNYTVLCCDQDDNGDYIVQNEYRFALNVESGAVGNNNQPNVQQNFTRYPIRQPVSANFRSGTLASLIGVVKDGNYVDRTGLMDELYALSVSTQTKFLKTRKGQIFQIETMSPISMQISDKYVQQPVKISLPWVEVGDASNANILGESTDFALPHFYVEAEYMELTMEYRPVSPYNEYSFALADGNLYLNNPGPYNANDFVLTENGEVILYTEGEGE